MSSDAICTFAAPGFSSKFADKTGLPARNASTKVPPCFYRQLAGVAQLVRAPVCGTGGRRFETGHSPHHSFAETEERGKCTAFIHGPVIVQVAMVDCGRGGIGRRAGFRYQWRKSWGFKSLRPHHWCLRQHVRVKWLGADRVAGARQM